MSAYYNEIDAYAAQWLRNLIAAGHIAPGDVDERSIEDVRPADLVGYRQCHFFAGIGVWSYALRRSGWPDDRHVWTASCPCQPFSQGGLGLGFDDERHLWPCVARLVRERKPPVVFGEQVSSPDGLAWLDFVLSDLEALGYTGAAVISSAAGVAAPHGRHRTYWVADAHGARDEGSCGSVLAGETRPWWVFGEAHLRALTQSPEQPGESWPQPILRVLDDGIATRVGRLRAYGNAICAPQAIAFIEAYRDVREVDPVVSPYRVYP